MTTPSAWLPVAMALGVVVWAYILGVAAYTFTVQSGNIDSLARPEI